MEAIGGKMPGIVLRNMPRDSKATVYGCLSHENVGDIGIFDLLVENNAKHIVEFGTSFGISTLYLGAAAKRNGGKKTM